MHVLSHLDTLDTAGLIYPVAPPPEEEYIFRHTMVQEAAYAVLLLTDRRRLHRAVGRVLEQEYEERAEELAPILGHHFALAGDDERALAYFLQAAGAAARVYANLEALGLYDRAREIIRRGAVVVGSEPLRRLYLGRGRALELTGRYHEALQNYEELEALAKARGDRALELGGLLARVIIRSTQNPAFQPAEAHNLAQAALALARELSDRAAEARVLWGLSLAHIFSGRSAEGLAHGEAALQLSRELELRELTAFVLHDLWLAYLSTSQLAKARAAAAEGRGLWRELGNLPLLAENVSRSSISALAAGDFAEAIALSDEAFQLSVVSDNLEGQAISRATVGYAFLEQGQMEQALAMMETAVDAGDRSGNILARSGARSELARLYGLLGRHELGLAAAETAQQVAEESFPIARSWGQSARIHLHLLMGDVAAAGRVAADMEDYRVVRQKIGFAPSLWIRTALTQGELLLAQGRPEAALVLLEELVGDLQRSGLRAFVPEGLRLKGEALLALEPPRVADAQVALGEALAAAQGLDSHSRQWPILQALARLAAAGGRQAEAEALQEQAWENIQYYAEELSRPDWRDSFLQNATGGRLAGQQ